MIDCNNVSGSIIIIPEIQIPFFSSSIIPGAVIPKSEICKFYNYSIYKTQSICNYSLNKVSQICNLFSKLSCLIPNVCKRSDEQNEPTTLKITSSSRLGISQGILEILHAQDTERQRNFELKLKQIKSAQLRQLLEFDSRKIERTFLAQTEGPIDEYMRDIDKIRTQTQESEEEVAKQKAELEEQHKKLDEIWEDLLRFLRDPNSTISTDCPQVSAMQDLDDFTRLIQNNLNPDCLDHAKVIMTPKGQRFDEALFEKAGCNYIKSNYRKLSLLAAPDKNRDRQKEATVASRNLNVAAQTLCRYKRPA